MCDRSYLLVLQVYGDGDAQPASGYLFACFYVSFDIFAQMLDLDGQL